jgi:acyl carrier protein
MDRIDPDAKFSRLGLDSVNSVTLIIALEEWLGMELDPGLAFDYPTLRKLSEHLADQLSVNPGAR